MSIASVEDQPLRLPRLPQLDGNSGAHPSERLRVNSDPASAHREDTPSQVERRRTEPSPQTKFPSIAELFPDRPWESSRDSSHPVPAEQRVKRYFLDGLELREYTICQEIYVMQKPPKNETYSTFQRKTLDGRILEYRLNVIQEPEKARACGSGPRSSSDRRPVDPPPVVSLTIHDGNQDITMQYESSLYLYASLEFARPIARSHMQEPSHKYPVLTGACVTGAAYLQKPQLAAYFIFSDMSVRHEGFYRLRFHLLEQVKNPNDEDPEPAADNPMVTARPTGDILQNRTFVYSKPFQVFSAKKFPGLSQSTALSMELQAQGCRVRIRRDVRQRRQTTKKGMDDDDSLSVHGTPRALSHERSASRESLDRRPIPADYSRRPSLEAHTPISYIPSRNQSRDFGPLPSPTSAGGFQQLPRTTLPPLSGSSMPAPAPYSQSYSQSRPMQMPPPPPRLNVSPATDAMRQLPSLQSLGPAPPPRGSYHPTSLLSKRSHSSYAYEPRNPLKDRARPDTVPERRTTVEFLMNPIAPLSNGTDRIEADDDDAPDSSDHEIDPFMIRTYRRADGTKASVGHVLNR